MVVAPALSWAASHLEAEKAACRSWPVARREQRDAVLIVLVLHGLAVVVAVSLQDQLPHLPARPLAAMELAISCLEVAIAGGCRYPATVLRNGLASFSSRGSGALQIYCSRQFEFDPIAFTSSSTSHEVFCNLSSIVRCPHGCRQRL